MSQVRFQSSPRIRRLASNLEGEQIFENILFPDAILNDLYSDKYENNSSGKTNVLSMELFPLTCYQDASFKQKGISNNFLNFFKRLKFARH